VTRIFASLTSIDVGELAAVVERLEEAGVDGFHIDLSDGVFTPGLTFGPSVVAAVTSRTRLPVEAHLMTTNPESHVPALADAGTSRIAFHWEATLYPHRVVTILQQAGCGAGIAFNPATPIPQLAYLDSAVSFVNILTTEPDVAGERLLPAMADRVGRFRAALGPELTIEVDGGVGRVSMAALIAAGADDLVVGRALVAAPDPRATVTAMRSSI
jgi:ribulose-phosphate 3-epimerase